MRKLIVVARIAMLLLLVGGVGLSCAYATTPDGVEVGQVVQATIAQGQVDTLATLTAGEPALHDGSVNHRWENLYHHLFSKEVWALLLGGLYTTVVIFVFAAVLAILLGAALAYCAINHRWPWIYKPLNWFIVTIHDVPSVVLMMFFYYVIFAGEMNGVIVSIIALGIYTSGSLSKVFKIHILQVGKGQLEAGKMLGLTTRQCYRYIILPQAVKTILPLIIAELKVQLRATSYAGYIAQKDLVKMADAIRIHTDDTLVPLVIISLLYLLLSWVIAHVVHLLYEKLFNND